MSFRMTRITRVTKLALICCSILSLSCKRTVESDQFAVVGMEASIRDGQAPTFTALADWYQNFKVEFSNAAPGSTDGRAVNASQMQSSFDEKTKQYLAAWIADQNERLNQFRDALAKRDRVALRALLDAEAWEMYEIAAAFVLPTYWPEVPGKPDRLAMLIRGLDAHGLQTDLFAEEFLGQVMQRDLKTFFDQLELERTNYANSLAAEFLQNDEGLRKLEAVVQKSQGGLHQLSAALGGSLGPVAGMNLTTNTTSVDGVAGLLGQLLSFNGGGQASSPFMAGASGGKPNLSIFQGKDLTEPKEVAPEDTTPLAGGGSGTGGGAGGGTGGGSLMDILNQLLSGGGFQLHGNSAGALHLTREVDFPNPAINCNDGSRRGIDLIRCQRYLATLIPIEELNAQINAQMFLYKDGYVENASDAIDEDEQAPASLALNTRAYNVDAPAFFATPVKAQRDGSCTAYALSHTLDHNANRLEETPAHTGKWTDPEAMWSRQGRQPYMHAALDNAKRMTFSTPTNKTFRIKGTRSLRSHAEMKRVIDQGRVVFASSSIGSDWQSANSGLGKGGVLSCSGSSRGVGGHAYSIQGYDDAKQVWVIKNSWGASWGDSGYGYLPYNCFKLGGGAVSAYDVQIGS